MKKNNNESHFAQSEEVMIWKGMSELAEPSEKLPRRLHTPRSTFPSLIISCPCQHVTSPIPRMKVNILLLQLCFGEVKFVERRTFFCLTKEGHFRLRQTRWCVLMDWQDNWLQWTGPFVLDLQVYKDRFVCRFTNNTQHWVMWYTHVWASLSEDELSFNDTLLLAVCILGVLLGM